MSLGNALGYLTLLPVPHKKHEPLLRSVHYFPLVGAGMGSLAVLFFLAIRHYVPNALACFLTVAGLEVLYGGTPLRGVAEMAQGRRTYPGHGFDPGFKLAARGLLSVAILLLVKVIALASLPRDWQTHAVFVLPIMGRCAQTLAFVLSPRLLPHPVSRDPAIPRRCVRAGLLSATLLLLLFLFPWEAALASMVLFALIAIQGLKRLNARFDGLTLQTVSLLSELSETAVMALLAVSARILV
jgi:adenosylcobinamide-GDP ribazoletransferase